MPIIFGPKALRLNLKTEGEVQKVFCRNNYNLFLSKGPEEHFSIGAFLKSFGREVTNLCVAECDDNFGCRLFIKQTYMDESVDILPFPDWSKCQVTQQLLQLCQAKAERKFLEEYLSWSGAKCRYPSKYDGFVPKSDGKLPVPDKLERSGILSIPVSRYENYAEAWNSHGDSFSGARSKGWTAWDLSLWLLDLLVYPALIPQVWLNFIYVPELGPLDPQKEHLDENPSRVDFMMFEDGKRHVIEIDDPGHYAKLENRTWLVSEEEYTKNLRIERRLKWDGWLMHRFSNWEVLNAFNMEYFLAAIGIGGHEGVKAVSEEEEEW